MCILGLYLEYLLLLISQCLCIVLRLVLEFDLLFYAFGNLGTVTWAWIIMFAYTLLVPYYAMQLWGSLYHTFPSKLGLSLSTGLLLSAVQLCVLGQFPVHVVVQYQLPPASRFIVILEQVSAIISVCSSSFQVCSSLCVRACVLS